MDLRVQDSPDSSTSPRVKVPPTSGEERTVRKEDTAQGKKQKIRTVFSQAQLYVLNDRFQRQKYLSLQQMQELSNILNLSYKQVKTWFQNQRMKCKRWQKNHWPKESKSVTQHSNCTISRLLFLPPGIPEEHFWKPSTMEQPDLEQPVLEQPLLERPVLGQPLLERPVLGQPFLGQSDLVPPSLEQSAPELWRGIPAAPDPVPAKFHQRFGVHLSNFWGKP
ncbi:homeobox protein NANOG-like isoform X2 [Zalophus californianus]|uniref:Homeobox protein NANOG-like isoform X2 n=1 Tax=Zalophus californianus TaxID=9704 RepID=A0A6P9FM27_ZALCA|nr:homeobox protein NANOG-like isoform X2 [Zalophus californianus]